jgi:hypothetical protein
MPAPVSPDAPMPAPVSPDAERHIISLGAGVQSSTMAMMAAFGEIAPMPDAAIFADTQHEPMAVYQWLDWLEKQLPFPVYRVTAGDLWASATRVRKTRDGQRTYIATGIPVYISNSDGVELSTRKGIGKRQCTRDFKTGPVTKKVRALVGLKRLTKSTPVLATVWVGISEDESWRAKPSRERWIVRRHPLIELGMDRVDCIDWMRDHGFPEPPRSACTFCPFHDDESWLALSPGELADVALKEKELQSAYARTSAMTGVPYFHASRVPLSQVQFNPKPKSRERQYQMFSGECEGLCGT